MFNRCLIIIVSIVFTAGLQIGCGDDSDSPTKIETPDNEAPRVESVSVEDDAPSDVVVRFDEAVTAGSAAGFSITLNSVAVTISGLEGSGSDSLRLILPDPIQYPHILTLSYDQGSGDVQDMSDQTNELVTFFDMPVINNVQNSIETVAGGNGAAYSGDGGPATEAQLNEPWAVFCEGSNIYVADHMNGAIRRFSAGGNIETVSDHSYLGRPNDLWKTGDWIYVATNIHCIVRFQDGGMFDMAAGSAYQPGYSGDGGSALAAKMMDPYSVWASGDIALVADTYNERIRKFTFGGNINTVAGDGSYYGDLGDGGPATDASVSHPYCIRQHGGTFYVATLASRIRAFTEGGNIESVVSSGLYRPRGIAIYEGYIYIADTGNHAIKRVPLAGGELETLAGGIGAGYSGDGGPAAAARVDTPNGIHVAGGFIYIADTNNNAVRRMYVPR